MREICLMFARGIKNASVKHENRWTGERFFCGGREHCPAFSVYLSHIMFGGYHLFTVSPLFTTP